MLWLTDLLQFVARVIEEEMFGVDNLCWISAKATLEASRLAEFLILQTGMTAYGKAYYRNQNDLVPNVCILDLSYIYNFQKKKKTLRTQIVSVICEFKQLAAKLEALRDEYMRYAEDKWLSVLREYHATVETITGY